MRMVLATQVQVWLRKGGMVGPSQTTDETEAQGLSALSDKAAVTCGYPPSVRAGGGFLGVWVILCKVLSHTEQPSRSGI